MFFAKNQSFLIHISYNHRTFAVSKEKNKRVLKQMIRKQNILVSKILVHGKVLTK